MSHSKIPLFRDLSYCRSRDYAEASKEVAITVISSTVPIWLGLIFAWVSPTWLMSEYLSTFILSGELLLLSTALVGPSFYIITKRYGSDLESPYSKHFFQGWFFILLAMFVCLIAAGIFGYNRLSTTTIPHGVGRGQLNFGPMVILSVATFMVANFVLFLVITIENFMDGGGAAGVMHSDTQAYVKEFQK